MTLIPTDLLVGSIENMSDQSFTIDSGNVSVAEGSYYLYSDTSSLNLMTAVQTALSNAGADNPSVFLREDLRVQINFDTAESITWGSATDLRNYLGFDGDSGSSTSHTSAGISYLLWSPGYRASYKTIEGVHGDDMDNTILVHSSTGKTVSSTRTHTTTLQTLSWDVISTENRGWTTSENGGEFKRFRDTVLRETHKFYLFQNITEDTNSSSAITWTSQFGPYHLQNYSQVNGWYNRAKIKNANTWFGLTLRLIKADDYS